MSTDDWLTIAALVLLGALVGLWARAVLEQLRDMRWHTLRTAAATEALLREMTRLRELAEPHPPTVFSGTVDGDALREHLRRFPEARK